MRNLIASLVLICSATCANAQCGVSYGSYAPSYPTVVERVVIHETPIVVALPSVYTVAIPVTSYLYGGAAFGAVPAAAGYPGMIQPAAAAPTAAAPTNFEISDAMLDKLIDRIEKRLQQRQSQPVQVQPGQNPPPVKTSMTVDEVNTRAFTVLKQSCSACHGNGQRKGGITIFGTDGQMVANLDRRRIVGAISSGAMPQISPLIPHVPVSDRDLAVLEAWKTL